MREYHNRGIRGMEEPFWKRDYLVRRHEDEAVKKHDEKLLQELWSKNIVPILTFVSCCFVHFLSCPHFTSDLHTVTYPNIILFTEDDREVLVDKGCAEQLERNSHVNRS